MSMRRADSRGGGERFGGVRRRGVARIARARARFGRLRRLRIGARLAAQVSHLRRRRTAYAGLPARLRRLAPVVRSRRMRFPELTYATPGDPLWRRLAIRALEHISGRGYFEPLYERWQAEHVGTGGPLIAPMLDLCGIPLEIRAGQWPPKGLRRGPLVIVANHPYGILDGIGALTLAEQLGGPFKILIHKDLMKVKEVAHHCLPIDFAETRAAQAANIRTRNEALQLLREGTTIVVFPAGGVATAPDVFGEAVDLPWKTFTARMIMSAKAQVVPIYFEGQCSPLFHAVSKFSQLGRLAMIIRELRRRVQKPLRVRIGQVMQHEELAAYAGSDRKALTNLLFERVYSLSDRRPGDVAADVKRLPAWLRGLPGDR